MIGLFGLSVEVVSEFWIDLMVSFACLLYLCFLLLVVGAPFSVSVRISSAMLVRSGRLVLRLVSLVVFGPLVILSFTFVAMLCSGAWPRLGSVLGSSVVLCRDRLWWDSVWWAGFFPWKTKAWSTQNLWRPGESVAMLLSI